MSSLRANVGEGSSNHPLSTIESVSSEVDDGYETPIDDFPQEKNKVVGEIGTRRRVLSFFGRSRASRASTASRSSNASQLPVINESNVPPVPSVPADLITPLHDNPEQRRYHTPNASVSSTLVPPTPPRGDTVTASTPPRNISSPTPSKSTVATAYVPPSMMTADGSEKGTISTTRDSAALTNPESRFSWHQTNPEKLKSAFTRWFVEWWMFEICCWLFSLACMAVIVGVLLHFNHKPIPKWKAGMTLNSFVSVLAGFGRAALLVPTAEALGQLKWDWFTRKSRRLIDFEVLDNASRGPWGSFMLLARSKGM
jgi:hypothetical protein